MKKIAYMLLGSAIFCACGTQEVKVSTTGDTSTTKEAVVVPGDNTTTGTTANTTVDSRSADFAAKAASGSMMEVELGRWAQDHAVSQAVKDFGAMMVTDHSAAASQLQSIASAKNISLPAAVPADVKRHMDDLMAKQTKDFDRAYVDMMVDDHQKDVREFEEASRNLSDVELRDFAARTLPTLQKHYEAIKLIRSKM
jgi:putative membrane protein